MKGVTATTIKVKSQFSQNIIPSMPRMVNKSTMMLSVDEDAKPWMVWMSVVIVLSRAPV